MKHCILVKYKDEVTAEDRERLYPEIGRLFDGLRAMDGIHDVELIRNVINRPNRFDLLIRIDMDPEALSAYDDSNVHHQWKDQYGKYLAKKAIFDYED
ncbi:MAG: Dabb family protein [Eubacteriales bacterium]|jgi:pantothenate kinase-related protein Tda10